MGDFPRAGSGGAGKRAVRYAYSMKTKSLILAAVAMVALAFGATPAKADDHHHHYNHHRHSYHHGYYHHHYGYYRHGYVRTAPVVIINP